jgi:hypothetical protein
MADKAAEAEKVFREDLQQNPRKSAFANWPAIRRQDARSQLRRPVRGETISQLLDGGTTSLKLKSVDWPQSADVPLGGYAGNLWVRVRQAIDPPCLHQQLMRGESVT